MVETVDRRTNMIMREKRRAGGTRSSRFKQMERRDDQDAWRVDKCMGGEADCFDRCKKMACGLVTQSRYPNQQLPADEAQATVHPQSEAWEAAP